MAKAVSQIVGKVLAKLPTATKGRPTSTPTIQVCRHRIVRKFSDFQPLDADLGRALKAAKQFAADILANPHSGGYCLSILGESGTGKTMLAECVLHALRWNMWGNCDSIEPRFIKGELVQFSAGVFDMRKVSDGFKEGKFEIVDFIESRSLTILDDVGADHDPSKVTASKVDRILRSRRGKWTLITSNLYLSQLKANLDGRIASFLIRDNNKYVEIKAQDYSLRKLKGKS